MVSRFRGNDGGALRLGADGGVAAATTVDIAAGWAEKVKPVKECKAENSVKPGRSGLEVQEFIYRGVDLM
jgi:hypothetical protein